MKKTNIFFVTTIRVHKKNNIFLNENRCIGFYPKLKDAREVIKEHSECLAESGYYKYAVIEKIGFGWYPTPELEEWYKFTDKDKKAKEIKKPKEFKGFINWSIG